MKKLLQKYNKGISLITLVMFFGFQGQGQTANTYAFSTGTGASLLAPTYTQIIPAARADAASAVINFGAYFTFTYEGNSYTQFSANSNGLLRLGSTVVGTTATNSISAASNQPKVMPLWDDLSTASNGGVYWGVSGTAPNRILVIDYKLYHNNTIATAYDCEYQIWLYETTNVIKFVYGTGVNTASSSCGIGGTTSTNYQSVTITTNTSSSAAENNTNTAWPGSGRYYAFCASAPLYGITTICSGESTTLSSQIGTSWVWNSGPTTQSITISPVVNTTYTVTASMSGCAASSSATVTVNTLPACTNTPSPSNGSTNICVSQTLSWASVANATSYDVYFGTNPTPSYYTNVTSASCPVTLITNTTYYWYIVPKNTCGSASGCSGTVWSFSTFASDCNVPTGLSSASVTNISAIINWSAPCPAPASGYNIYYSTSATPPTGGTTPSASVGAGVTTFSIGGLAAGTTYYVWVRSNCGGGNYSSWAGSINFTTTTCGGGKSLYRTRATGNWTAYATVWQIYTGGSWQNVTTSNSTSPYYPTSANCCSAEICNGHVVTLNVTFSAPNTTIDYGGKFDIPGGAGAYTVTYSSGYVLTNNGTLTVTAGGSQTGASATWDGKGLIMDGTLINYQTDTNKIYINPTGVIVLSYTTAGATLINYGTINNSGGYYYWNSATSSTTNYYYGIYSYASNATTVTNYGTFNNNGINNGATGYYRTADQYYNLYNYGTYGNIFKRALSIVKGNFSNYPGATIANSGNFNYNGGSSFTVVNYSTYNENWASSMDNAEIFINAPTGTISLGNDGCLRTLSNISNGAQIINNGLITNANIYTPDLVDGLVTNTNTSLTNNNIIIDNGPINNLGTFTNTTTGQFIYKKTTGSIAGNSLRYLGNALLDYNGTIPQTTSNYEWPMDVNYSPNYIKVDNSSGIGFGVTLHAARTVNYNTGNPPNSGFPYLTLTNGAVNLNTFTLTINSPSKTVIARDGVTQLGYIVSEQNAATNTSILKWNCGAATGSFVYPFGAVDGSYIPVTFNKTTDNFSHIGIATRPTVSTDNSPLTTGVADMFCQDGDDGTAGNVVDRWWEITPTGTGVVADVTFSYRAVENTLATPTDMLAVQHWDPSGPYWNDGRGGAGLSYYDSGTNGLIAGVGSVTATGLTQFNTFILDLGGGDLPVELLDFKASCNNEKIDLNWSTASETNNNYFVIEKSRGNGNWDYVTTVHGAGYSNSKIEYSVKDESPYDETAKGLAPSYYRLKQVDFDGQYEYFSPVETTCKSEFTFNSFVNENKEIIIEFNAEMTQEYVVNLYDCNGKNLLNAENISTEGSNKIILNTDNYSKGIYLLTFKIGNEYQTRKIMF